MIDTHCHLDFDDFNENRNDIVKSAIENGVYKIINPCSYFDSNFKAQTLSLEYDNVYFSVGLHPEEIENLDYEFENKIKELEKIILDKKCVAVGEIGLDYHFLASEQVGVACMRHVQEIREKQKELFIAQLNMAKKYDKPVIIHNRDSREDIYDILKQYSLNGVFHCFSEDKDFAKKILDLGFYISFTGNITFKNAKDFILEAVKYIPENRILCETDSPFLAPQEFRGQTNKPEYVKYVYEKICELRGIEFKEFEKQVDENVKNLFNI